jgi:hypothetical protein
VRSLGTMTQFKPLTSCDRLRRGSRCCRRRYQILWLLHFYVNALRAHVEMLKLRSIVLNTTLESMGMWFESYSQQRAQVEAACTC